MYEELSVTQELAKSKIITYIPDSIPKEPRFQFRCCGKTLDMGPTGTHFGGYMDRWMDAH